ncbi:MAG: phosphatidylserine decarboxylase family protein, partial [Hoylesella buccalis]
MIKRIKKLKKIRIHREGTDTLIWGFIVIAAIALLLWRSFETKIPFYAFTVIFGTIYCIVINFFQCPIRYFPSEDTDKIVVAPADGKIVVIEEVEENK